MSIDRPRRKRLPRDHGGFRPTVYIVMLTSNSEGVRDSVHSVWLRRRDADYVMDVFPGTYLDVKTAGKDSQTYMLQRYNIIPPAPIDDQPQTQQ